MNRTVLIALVLLFLLTATAQSATEFNLGGYVKLEMWWDSTQEGKNMNTAIARDNDPNFHHGRFRGTAQYSRINLKIKGPDLWGAKTNGFIEMDFDSESDPSNPNASNGYMPRLRHAMFQMIWPATKLLCGQYYALLDEYRPESLQDTPLQYHGATSYRVPQIRLTQKFAQSWTVAASINSPTNFTKTDAVFDVSPLGDPGESSETPNFQGMIRYEKDLWGKAPFEGNPRGFTAQVTGGWQRVRYQRGTGAGFRTFGQNNFGSTTVSQKDQQYLAPWMVKGNLIIPVIPCRSYNLAGSATLTLQWYLGQGLNAFGFARDNDASWFDFIGRNTTGALLYDRQLMLAYGGYIQAQYWFTNAWFLNVLWGFQRQFGVDQDTSPLAAQATNPAGYKYASNNDQVKRWQEFDLTLYYQPIKALKFGLQYTFGRTDWLQETTIPAIGGRFTDFGTAHRIQSAAYMYF